MWGCGLFYNFKGIFFKPKDKKKSVNLLKPGWGRNQIFQTLDYICIGKDFKLSCFERTKVSRRTKINKINDLKD